MGQRSGRRIASSSALPARRPRPHGRAVLLDGRRRRSRCPATSSRATSCPNPVTLDNFRTCSPTAPVRDVLRQQRDRHRLDRRAQRALRDDGGLCVRQAAVPGPGRHLLHLPADPDGPVPGQPDPALPDHGGAPQAESRPRRRHVLRADRAGRDPGLRDLPDAPVPAVDPRRDPGVGPHGRRVGVADRALDRLPAGGARAWRRWRSSRSSGPGTTSCGR